MENMVVNHKCSDIVVLWQKHHSLVRHVVCHQNDPSLIFYDSSSPFYRKMGSHNVFQLFMCVSTIHFKEQL